MADEQNKNKTFAWGSHVVSAGSNILNTITNQVLAEHNREANFKWNELAADKADERHRKQFDDMYSYAAQVEQAKKAGLSPSILFGSGVNGQGGASSPQSQGVQGLQAPYASIIDPVQAAQIENIKADTELKQSEANNLDKDTELKGQEIINLITEDKNNRARFRLINAEADLAELEFSVDTQTAQATISEAYSNAAKAANQARITAVQADLDEATFQVAYEMAYANLDNVLTDTALKKAQINLSKAQIKEIAERIRNSQWETWATEKEQNRRDAAFNLDKAYYQSEVKKWAAELNVKLAEAEMEMVSDLVGYICSFAECGLSRHTELQKTEMYNQTKKDLANKKTVETETTVHPNKSITTKSKTKSTHT